MTITNGVGFFFIYFLAEVLYVHFVIYVSNREAAKAATCSALIVIIITLGIVKCVEDHNYLIPITAGAWLGAYVTTKTKSN